MGETALNLPRRCLAHLCLLAIASAASGAARAQAPLTVLYEERAPYTLTAGTGVTGLVGTPSSAAFERAGVPVRWQVSVQGRILSLLSANTAPVCAISLYRLPEREAYARFTRAVYRNGPVVALVRPAFPLSEPTTIEAALRAPNLRLLMRYRYSYGSYVDSRVAAVKPQAVAPELRNDQLADLMRANRADLMFASEEEAALLRYPNAGGTGEPLRIVHFTDAPPGETRHIACSRQVPESVMERLDKAIALKPVR
jgi:hypothetical protein